MRCLNIILAILAAVGFSLSAMAGVVDLRLRAEGHVAEMTLVFTAPVLGADVDRQGDQLWLSGVQTGASSWELQNAYPITALTFDDAEGGTALSLVSASAARIIASRIDGHAVIVSVRAEEPFDPSYRKSRYIPTAFEPATPPDRSVSAPAKPQRALALKPGNLSRSKGPKPDETSGNSDEASQQMGARVEALEQLQQGDALALLSDGEVTSGACAAAQERLAADSWDMESLRLSAICHAQAEEWETAQEFYERILAFSPEDAVAHMGLSVLAHRGGDVLTARSHLDSAFEGVVSDGQAAQIRLLREALLD
jgi:hypothetical protein